MTPAPQPASPEKKKGISTIIIIIVIVVLVGCCLIGGVLAAIAVPNFMKFQARSKQSEGKMVIRSLYTGERALNAEKDLYSENAEELGFTVEGKRYVCVLGRDGAPVGHAPKADELAAFARSHVAGTLGVSGQCPKCEFTAACAGNIDNDDDADVWSISSASRTGAHGQTITGGTPYNDYSDVTDSPGE